MTTIDELDPVPGCATAGRGDGNDRLPDALRARIDEHPCYSEQAHHRFARMHLAVAPACNIQCHYCNRKYDCSNESRPGVVSELLTPAQAERKLLAVAAAIPQLSVIGIAGPGDPLANPERTFETLDRVRRVAPDLTLCVSTNGLALPEQVDELVRIGIGHVTITMNTLDPEVGARIYPWIFHNHRRIRGRKAAEILIRRQLDGLERLVERGVLVKINSVVIPGVNDAGLDEVARAVKARGAFLHNLMPLISDPSHGTYYGLTGQRGPSDAELDAVRERCGSDMRLMRHCRQCRADAIGMLGEDRSAEMTLARIAGQATPDTASAAARRAAYREQVARNRAAERPTSAAGEVHVPIARLRRKPVTRALRVAVATKGMGLINHHFGHATEFLIYEANAQGVRLLGVRQVAAYCTGPEHCDEDERVIARTIRTLEGCDLILCARIGFGPWKELEAAGIEPVTDYAMEAIEPSIAAVHRKWLEAGRLEPDFTPAASA